MGSRIIQESMGEGVIERLEITREVKQNLTKEDILKRKKQAEDFILSQQKVIAECNSQLGLFSNVV